MGSAYLSPDGKRVVVVYVNMGSATGVNLNVSGQSAAKSIQLYRTSETENLKHITGSYTLGGRRIVVPKKSVSTFVIDFDEPIASGIAHVAADSKVNDNRIYNLNGQVMQAQDLKDGQLAKGIYIQNGKKFVVK